MTRDTHCRTLKPSQVDYIDVMLHRFDMSDCNPVTTPMDKGAHLKDEESAIFKCEKMFQALTGSLTYVAMSTCPDISYITQFLSQTNKGPKQCHWNATKRVLRYLNGKKD